MSDEDKEYAEILQRNFMGAKAIHSAECVHVQADEIARLRKDLARMSNMYLEAIGALKEARPLFHDCDATAIRMDCVINGDSHE